MDTAFSLKGKTAIITGGATGIGLGIATTLAEAGATVVIADRDDEGRERSVATLRDSGHNAESVYIDLADEISIVHACAEVKNRVGVPWILVNNAGLQDRQALLECTSEEWDRINDVNARGPLLITREIGRSMIMQGDGGRIINIATAALRGMIAKGHTAYLCSKGSLLALSHATAFEFAEFGITVNTVMPGGVVTPGALSSKGVMPEGPALRSPPLGFCEPKDIAAAVYFFSTPAAHRITNQVLSVDSGFSLT